MDLKKEKRVMVMVMVMVLLMVIIGGEAREAAGTGEITCHQLCHQVCQYKPQKPNCFQDCCVQAACFTCDAASYLTPTIS